MRNTKYQYDRERANLLLKIEAFAFSAMLVVATVTGIYGMI